jgi:multiple sugar transport system ATP-binding protein
VPAERNARYRPHVGKTELLFGLRPEHIADARGPLEPNRHAFEIAIEVAEPMGMETLVYFPVQGVQACARVSSAAGAVAGARLKLAADLDHMHLIDARSGRVL